MDKANSNIFEITPEILSLIAEIDEFRGAWRAIGQLAPEHLLSLRKVATIESIGSSTRIEGSQLTDRQVEELLSNLQIRKFDTRDEQEVAGYSEAMDTIFQNYEHIPFTENYIKQFHGELLKYSAKDTWHKGNYKKSPNHVEAFDPNSKSLGIIFETCSPFETPFRMTDIINWADVALEGKKLHPLLVISVFIVEFLAIHPFQDGNGRLSRILTTFLLLRAGYNYVPYSSLEAIVEQNKEGYYLALRKTQMSLKSSTPDLSPWMLFFLRALKQQKDKLESKIEKEKLLFGQLPELSIQILTLIKSKGRGTVKDIVMMTKANRNTVKKHLEALVDSQNLQRNGLGKGTWYSLKG